MRFIELFAKFIDFFSSDKSLVRATLLDYFAANAPPMAQWWRSTYIEGKNLTPNDPVHLDIEVNWRWTYAKKMVSLRPHKKSSDQPTFEIIYENKK